MVQTCPFVFFVVKSKGSRKHRRFHHHAKKQRSEEAAGRQAGRPRRMN
jgi:hypothetical protein